MNPTNTKYLDILHEVAGIIESGSGDRLNEILRIIARRLRLARCAISAVDPRDGKIRICAAFGLTAAQIARGEYRRGEGITGRVIARGEAEYVEDIAREPLFLNRTGSRKNTEKVAFICVPILCEGAVKGSLWLDQAPQAEDEIENLLKFFQILATLIGPLLHVKNAPFSEASVKNLGEFIGNSAAMKRIYAQIIQVAPSHLSVLLEGESGTGKELAARAIHRGSPASDGPFIAVNCAALPDNLIESELFGHEKGAFTSAIRIQKGKFELAHKGTLFLDEIGELGQSAQAKLLRALQEHAIERVGGSRLIPVNVRIIAATNRNLSEMVRNGLFREDLYYRLQVFPISLPPLRERIEDIEPLARHFLEEGARLSGEKALQISSRAMAMLKAYKWPGNVRQLMNVLERASLLAAGEDISSLHLPDYLDAGADKESQERQEMDLKSKIESLEKSAIQAELEKSGGHIGIAAQNLGVTERIFSLRLRRYGIDYREYRKKKICQVKEIEGAVAYPESVPKCPSRGKGRKICKNVEK